MISKSASDISAASRTAANVTISCSAATAILIADLRNLMLDFGYLKYYKQNLGFFDNFTATVSYNSQREERINQGGQGNPLGAITNDKERTTTWGFAFFSTNNFGETIFSSAAIIISIKSTRLRLIPTRQAQR